MQRTAQFRDGIFRIGNEIAADARAGQQAVDQSDILLAARDVSLNPDKLQIIRRFGCLRLQIAHHAHTGHFRHNFIRAGLN